MYTSSVVGFGLVVFLPFFPALVFLLRLSVLTCSCPRRGPFLHPPVWRIFISAHSLQVGASAEEPRCQEISSCSYITLVISGGSRWTFAQCTLLWQEKGYKTLGPVSRCRLGENLSGLWVPCDWIIMNNEWGFMLHRSINKTGMPGRNSGHLNHTDPPGLVALQHVSLPHPGICSWSQVLLEWQSKLHHLRFSLWVVIKDKEGSCVSTLVRADTTNFRFLYKKIQICNINISFTTTWMPESSVETEALWEISNI